MERKPKRIKSNPLYIYIEFSDPVDFTCIEDLNRQFTEYNSLCVSLLNTVNISLLT